MIRSLDCAIGRFESGDICGVVVCLSLVQVLRQSIPVTLRREMRLPCFWNLWAAKRSRAVQVVATNTPCFATNRVRTPEAFYFEFASTTMLCFLLGKRKVAVKSLFAESLRCETSFRRILVETTGIENTRCRTPKVLSISQVLFNAFTGLTSNYLQLSLESILRSSTRRECLVGKNAVLFQTAAGNRA